MAFYDPTFEQRRRSIIGGTVSPTVSTGRVSTYTDPNFETRRTQIISQPETPKLIIPTPTSIPQSQITPAKTSLIEKAKSFLPSQQKIIAPIPDAILPIAPAIAATL